MKEIKVIQGTVAWLQARSGHVTASAISDVLSKKNTKGYQNYKFQIASEILLGRPLPRKKINSEDIRRGHKLEPLAAMAYEVETNQITEKVGFVLHPCIEKAGCSPDRIILDGKGLAEIKCPIPAVHIQTIVTGVVPSEYREQCLWQMACTEREYVDYLSYCEFVPENLQLVKIRVYRDDLLIKEMEKKTGEFLDEVDYAISKLRSLADWSSVCYPLTIPDDEAMDDIGNIKQELQGA